MDTRMRDTGRLVDTLNQYRELLRAYSRQSAIQFLTLATDLNVNVDDILGDPYWDYSLGEVIGMLHRAEITEGKAASLLNCSIVQVRGLMIKHYGENWRDGPVEGGE